MRRITLKRLRELQFQRGITAHGSETKPELRSQSPQSHGITSIRHRHIRLYKEAKSDNLDAFRQLIIIVAKNIISRSDHEKLDYRGVEHQLAFIILAPLVYDDEVTERQASHMLKVPRTTYQRWWKPAIADMRQWIKNWGLR